MFLKYVLPLFFCSIFTSFAQSVWHELGLPDNIANQRFDDVFFINDNTGWAANGFFAAVYKTTDGGENWTEQLNETILGGDFYFRNIEFLDENIGFLGTLNGNFYKTINGGTTWTEVTNITPNPPAICGLEAIGTTVYGCGAYFEPAYIIKSSDSGDTWQHIDMSAYATALVELLFTSETHGYAAGKNASGGLVLETNDGGATWTEIYNTNVAGEYVWKLNSLPTDNTHLFGAVESVGTSNGKLILSADSGANWTSKDGPETHLQAVGFVSPTRGWIGGHTTGFHETNDAGDTWTNVGVGGNLNRIFIINSDLAYASGTTIYKFSDPALSIDDSTISHERIPLNITLDKNPIKDELKFTIHFNARDNIIIELYDINGKFIKKLKRDIISIANPKTYAFEFPYASGTYILSFHNNTGRQTLKFIKQ